MPVADKSWIVILLCAIIVMFGLSTYLPKNNNSDNTGYAVNIYQNFSQTINTFSSPNLLNFSSSDNTKAASFSVSDDAVYNTAYVSINGSAWQPITLTGTTLSGNWLQQISTGTYNIQRTNIPNNTGTDNYIIIYSCSKNITGSITTWNCHNNKWQIKTFNTTKKETGNIIPSDNPTITINTPNNGVTITTNTQTITATTTSNTQTSTWIDFDKSLIGYWSMDSYSSMGIYDNSSYKNFGTFSGGLSTNNIVTGVRGNALSFDGLSNEISIPDTTPRVTNSFTVSAWVKFNQAATSKMYGETIVIKNSFYGIERDYNSNAIGLYVKGTDKLIGTQNTWTPGRWYHIVGVADGTTGSIYIDGVLDKSGLITLAPTETYDNIEIGGLAGFTSQTAFNGSIDEVMIFNRALTQSEISALYNSKANNFYGTFNNLANGLHTYTVYAIDSNGNFANSGQRTLNVNRVITPPTCTDTCTSLGYTCGTQTICGKNVNCGTCTSYSRTFYVSSSSTSSTEDGSINNPWKSLDEVNSQTFKAGDGILFKRGDTFRGTLIPSGSGSSGNVITYSAYDSGAKPLILGSKDISSTGSWTNTGDNIWRTTSTINSEVNDIGNLIFNNEASFGFKKTTLGGCASQGDYFFNTGDKLIYMYSSGNPGTYYSHIEAGGAYTENIAVLDGLSYVTFDNLDFRYSANNGIFLSSTDNIIIENCDVSWIGGMFVPSEFPVRMGNGIQMWNSNSNIILRYNRINQVYDAGISPQGGGTYTQQNIQMYYNVISNCYYSYEIFNKPGSTLTNVNFYNNDCSYSGSQWSSNQRPDNGHQEHIRNGEAGGQVTDCNIKNNIFYQSANTCYEFQESLSGWNIDYNLVYVNKVAEYLYTSYTTLSQWQSGTSQDANSISGNPSFVSTYDFHLQKNSPAIDKGIAISGLTRDFEGNAIVGAPDIGAFEYP